MTDSPGVLFQRLLDIMKRLREPGGCPWDREQTPISLKPFLIEEAYEVLEAIESGRSAAVQEELGDLLFQVVFHARLAGVGVVEFKGLLSLRDLLAASPLAGLAPASWLERQVWLHLSARASLEVGASRSQRRYLRFDVQWLAIGRQPLPGILLRLLPSSALQGLLRWRMPQSVEGITIEPGTVVIKTSS